MGFLDRLRRHPSGPANMACVCEDETANKVSVRVVEDTHTFEGEDGATWWAAGYAPIAEDGHFLSLAEHMTSDPRVLYCRVAGVEHYPEALQDERFRPSSPLMLRPEPDNPYDPNAVGVWDGGGAVQVGYIPRDLSARIAARIRAGEVLAGLVLREIRRHSESGMRSALHIVVTPVGVFNLVIADEDDVEEGHDE